MKLYRTTDGAVLVGGGRAILLDEEWDALFNREDLRGQLEKALRHAPSFDRAFQVDETASA